MTEWPLSPQPTPAVMPAGLTLPLAIGRGPVEPATVWVRPGLPAAVVADLCERVGLEAAGGFELAAVAGPLTLVRAGEAVADPGWPDGFVPVPHVRGLTVPVGRRQDPVTARRLAPPTGCVRWLTADGAVWSARVAFRPAGDWIAFHFPSPRLCDAVRPADPFAPLDIPTPPAPNEPALPVPRTTARRPHVGRATRVRAVAAAVLPAAFRPATVPPATADLERRLVADGGELSPTDLAGLWAELATAYSAERRTDDAAAAWANTVWHHPAPPPALLRRLPDPAGREDDRPTRAAWLAALDRHATDGDTLALVRCRDRLLPRVGRDVPAFVRRTDRRPDPAAVREWLLAAAEPIRKWLAKGGRDATLAAVGLDGDGPATRRYAELLIARGLAAAGDRTAAERAAGAVERLKTLRRPAAVDPRVHAVLADHLRRAVAAAFDGDPVPPPDATALCPFGRYAVAALAGPVPLDTSAARAAEQFRVAADRHRPDLWRDTLTGLDAATALQVAGPLFAAARRLNLSEDAARTVGRLAAHPPPPGGRRDLGLAIGRFAVGDEGGGDRALDAARQRLFVAGVINPRQRGETAVAYAEAVGHAAPGVVFGRLDELFRRLPPVDPGGACGRYFALLPLRLVAAAVRAAVGDPFVPSAAVRRFLAAEELATRRRIGRDIKRLLPADEAP